MLHLVLLTWIAAFSAPPALAQAVGIRITPTVVDPATRQGDLDLTMYTRYYTGGSPPASLQAGVPTAGIPALNHGDGSTIPTTTLLLAGTGTGPGGSNVYRSAASFSHTYPSHSRFTARAGILCTLCFRSSYVYFPAGDPPPTTFTGGLDNVPTSVIGNLAATYVYSGTFPTPFGGDYSVRYLATVYLAVTNTAEIDLTQGVLEIPTVGPLGLSVLGTLLALAGAWILRRL